MTLKLNIAIRIISKDKNMYKKLQLINKVTNMFLSLPNKSTRQSVIFNKFSPISKLIQRKSMIKRRIIMKFKIKHYQ